MISKKGEEKKRRRGSAAATAELRAIITMTTTIIFRCVVDAFQCAVVIDANVDCLTFVLQMCVKTRAR